MLVTVHHICSGREREREREQPISASFIKPHLDSTRPRSRRRESASGAQGATTLPDIPLSAPEFHPSPLIPVLHPNATSPPSTPSSSATTITL